MQASPQSTASYVTLPSLFKGAPHIYYGVVVLDNDNICNSDSHRTLQHIFGRLELQFSTEQMCDVLDPAPVDAVITRFPD